MEQPKLIICDMCEVTGEYDQYTTLTSEDVIDLFTWDICPGCMLKVRNLLGGGKR